MELVPGHFYRSRNNKIWCCFRVNKDMEEQAQAYCVCVSNHRIEYFYLDGRYDEKGEREHTLVEDVSLNSSKKV